MSRDELQGLALAPVVRVQPQEDNIVPEAQRGIRPDALCAGLTDGPWPTSQSAIPCIFRAGGDRQDHPGLPRRRPAWPPSC